LRMWRDEGQAAREKQRTNHGEKRGEMTARRRLQRLVRPLADVHPQFYRVESRPPLELANRAVPVAPCSLCSTLPELLLHHGLTPQPGSEQTSCEDFGLLRGVLKCARVTFWRILRRL